MTAFLALRALGGWLIKRPWVIGLIVLGLWGFKGRVEASLAKHARDEAVATLNADKAAHQAALAKAQADALTERTRILATQQKALDDANERTRHAQQQRAQAASSLADSQRLLHDAIGRIGGSADGSGAAAAGDSAATRRLGALLDSCAAEHRQLALDADAALDAARIAGQACERAYDALTPPPTTR